MVQLKKYFIKNYTMKGFGTQHGIIPTPGTVIK